MKFSNDKAKVSKIFEKITNFGGIFLFLDKFDRILSNRISPRLMYSWISVQQIDK